MSDGIQELRHYVPSEMKILPVTTKRKAVSLTVFVPIHATDCLLVGNRLVTVAHATAQSARLMNPEVRTAQPNPTSTKSRSSIIGYTTPPRRKLSARLRESNQWVFTYTRSSNGNSQRRCSIFAKVRRYRGQGRVETGASQYSPSNATTAELTACPRRVQRGRPAPGRTGSTASKCSLP